MKVKKYKAENMKAAMHLVRLELGDDAVILNSKPVKTRKFFGLVTKNSVEVIAAVDDEPIKQLQQTFKISDKRDEISHSLSTKPSILTNGNQEKLLENIQEMKVMMTNITKGVQRDTSLSDDFLKLEKRLHASELSAEYTSEIIDYLYNIWLNDKEITYSGLLKYLEKELLLKLEDIKFEVIPFKKKFVCLVGPTGVGKTTTLAKLAANASLKFGKKIGFITTDTYRIAAIEQLKTYANILDAPIEVCYSPEDFKFAKDKLSHLDVVFIDTAGRNYLNNQFVEELKQIINFQEEMTTYLVLSLTSKMKDMKIITDQFWNVGIDHFIFTKEDETSSKCSMYTLSRHYQKGATFVTNGQNVPEDIRSFSKELLVKIVLEELQNE
ncbi:flagellar biosynthesis protein FlhF [Sutcliffiella rhizosphaerae]|uniref:Flagellar biosynthesis protein FlhF n=1 Tax=Sutcliffiella rhizosphaerae TaxID=2880967 RepID=A0ABM8YIM3_9BACI|nr:flagellar biosynthesis protein FlhF [Sutcliffiella rhizosphaerae]CAG9619694.1 Flagellar biosynthesis protein FlhF [Sutcliffiella rhizosphaerae]